MSIQSLPPELLTITFDFIVHVIGIKAAARLRTVSRLFDQHAQEAIYNLPVFEHVNQWSLYWSGTPAHLMRSPHMSEAMIARLILSKLCCNQASRRELTCCMLRTVEFISTEIGYLGSEIRRKYMAALATVAAHALPLLEVVRRLTVHSSIEFAECTMSYALAAAIHLGRIQDVRRLIQLSANLDSPGALFEHLFSAVARTGHRGVLDLVLDHSSKADSNMQWRAHYMAEALCEAAEVGNIECAKLLLDDLARNHTVDSMSIHDAIKNALRAQHEDTALFFLDWSRENFSALSPYPTFTNAALQPRKSMLKVLQVACSTGSEHAVDFMLANTPSTLWGGSFNILLEDACRYGHITVVRRLLSARSQDSLTSYSSALYWAARHARHEILLELLTGVAKGDFSAFVDALAGSVFATESTVSFTLDVGALFGCQDLRRLWPVGTGSACFVKLVDALVRSGAPARFAAFRENNFLNRDDLAGLLMLPMGSCIAETLRIPGKEIMDRVVRFPITNATGRVPVYTSRIPIPVPLMGRGTIERTTSWKLSAACKRREIASICQIILEEERLCANFDVDMSQGIPGLGDLSGRAIGCGSPDIFLYIVEKSGDCPNLGSALKRFDLPGQETLAICQLHLDLGCRLNVSYCTPQPPPTWSNKSERLTRFFLERGADPAHQATFSCSAMGYAIASNASFLTLKLLVKAGANVHNDLLLHYAVHRNLPDCLQVVGWLLTLGVPVNEGAPEPNLTDREVPEWCWEPEAADTPLHVASAKGSPDIVALLLRHGADTSTKNKLEMTALDIAEESLWFAEQSGFVEGESPD